MVVAKGSGLLPVYKYDDYPGFTAKVTSDMTRDEAEQHIQDTGKKIREICLKQKVDLIIANHVLFSPVIVKRAIEYLPVKIPYVVKVHGSALTFIVQEHPEWTPYALEGMMWARETICGTKHIEDKLFSILPKKAMAPTRIVPPGVDLELFSLANRSAPENQINFIFVGKILNTKGIAELLLIWPRIIEKYPNVHLHIVGGGTVYVESLKSMIEALNKNDVGAFEKAARVEEFIFEDWDIKKEFKPMPDKNSIHYLGYKNHDELSKILPTMHLGVVPSKHPEAFGMVTIEQMAAGVYPICSNHSGLAEVLDFVSTIDSEVTQKMRIPLVDGKYTPVSFTKAILEVIGYFLKQDRGKLSARLNKLSSAYSWVTICEDLVQRK